MTRVAITVDQQVDQAEVLDVSPDKPRQNFLPGRIWLDVRDEIEPLGKRFWMPRTIDQERQKREPKHDPRLDDADQALMRGNEEDEAERQQRPKQSADGVRVSQKH